MILMKVVFQRMLMKNGEKKELMNGLEKLVNWIVNEIAQ